MAASKEINHRLVANIHDEPKQMLKPISGYERERLLSIEEACRPLENILGRELEENISIAKMNSRGILDGLTSDESASINLYTIEWSVRENSLYRVLNQTLRLADRTKLRPWFKYLKLFLTGLFKLPPIEYQTIWCGVSEDLSTRYSKGDKFIWWALSSYTSSISVLESPLYVGTTGPRTMFQIETNSGKSIREHSSFQHEDEILLPPGRYFEVIDKSNPGQDLHIIHLREIQPPHPTLSDPFDLSELKHALSQPKSVPDQSISHKNQENNRIASAILKPSASVTAHKEQSQLTASTLPYSQKQLDCRGHACANCGYCRDWYWQRYDADYMGHVKRPGTTCTGYEINRHHHYYYVDRIHSYGRLCECNNSQQ